MRTRHARRSCTERVQRPSSSPASKIRHSRCPNASGLTAWCRPCKRSSSSGVQCCAGLGVVGSSALDGLGSRAEVVGGRVADSSWAEFAAFAELRTGSSRTSRGISFAEQISAHADCQFCLQVNTWSNAGLDREKCRYQLTCHARCQCGVRGPGGAAPAPC